MHIGEMQIERRGVHDLIGWNPRHYSELTTTGLLLQSGERRQKWELKSASCDLRHQRGAAKKTCILTP